MVTNELFELLKNGVFKTEITSVYHEILEQLEDNDILYMLEMDENYVHTITLI